MAAWRTLGAGLVLLAWARAGRAQTYHLAEAVQADDCFRTRRDLTLTGETRVALCPAPILLAPPPDAGRRNPLAGRRPGHGGWMLLMARTPSPMRIIPRDENHENHEKIWPGSLRRTG
jgi:hypothetical protein